MADYKATTEEFTTVANAIRTKGGTQAQLEWPSGFVSAVNAIPTGGGGSLSWHDSLMSNWDFGNPVNTRGQSSYSVTSWTYTIDAWNTYQAVIDLLSNGIRITRQSGFTSDAQLVQELLGVMGTNLRQKKLTLSVLVDDVCYSKSFTCPTSTGLITDSVIRFGTNTDVACTVLSSTFAISIYARDDAVNHIIQAIKLEAGETQTLATLSNGVWTLNNRMDHGTEAIKMPIISKTS